LEKKEWREPGRKRDDWFNFGWGEEEWKVWRLRQRWGEGRREPPGTDGEKEWRDEMPFAVSRFEWGERLRMEI
jgi:hypothetical protein